MITLNLTDEEVAELANLLDLAVRTRGLAAVDAAVRWRDKLREAKQPAYDEAGIEPHGTVDEATASAIAKGLAERQRTNGATG